jgi:hypothetical protein
MQVERRKGEEGNNALSLLYPRADHVENSHFII